MPLPQMLRAVSAVALPVFVSAVLVVACGAASGDRGYSSNGSGGGGSNNNNGNGSGNSNSGVGSNHGNGDGTGGDSKDSGPLTDTKPPPPQEAGICTGDFFAGSVAPLDVYILLDATGSMNGGGEENKPNIWTPVINSLKDLVSDPMTEGIGVGMTYLPVPPHAGTVIPGSCKNTPCPPGKGKCAAPLFGAGVMLDKICDNSCTIATEVADCGLYGKCVVLSMPMFGTERYCNGASLTNISCDPADYGEPSVPIANLPGNKDAMITALSAKKADGDATPTQPGLEGTIRYAKQWATAHPDHIVNILFATDGEPNDCTFNSIDGSAEAAKTALTENPTIPTFVIGLGEKLSSLDKIAKSGGTNKAYIADGSTVASQLVTVFNEIRANGACKFIIPAPKEGDILNFEQVNVYFTPMAEDTQVAVAYVGTLSSCDPAKGGWYFDDPTKTNPTKIILCPATCERVRLSDKNVEIQLGCTTIVR